MSNEPKKVIVGEPMSASDFGQMIQAIQEKLALGAPVEEACEPFIPQGKAVSIEDAAGKIAKVIEKDRSQ